MLFDRTALNIQAHQQNLIEFSWMRHSILECAPCRLSLGHGRPAFVAVHATFDTISIYTQKVKVYTRPYTKTKRKNSIDQLPNILTVDQQQTMTRAKKFAPAHNIWHANLR